MLLEELWSLQVCENQYLIKTFMKKRYLKIVLGIIKLNSFFNKIMSVKMEF